MNTISILPTILLVIAFFGVMIFLHEFGHFLTARLCHVKVLEFSLGMGPKLVGYTSKKSGTLYALRLFPIGGYCAMLGEDRGEEGALADAPAAFCNRPAYQRFLILISGALMNLLSAFVVMCVALFLSGSFVSTTVSGFYVPSYAGGLQVGDVITAVNDTPVTTAEEVDAAIAALGTDTVVFTVERDGDVVKTQEIGLPQEYVDGSFRRFADFAVRGEGETETEVTHYTVESARAGLLVGDRITAVNGKKVSVYTDISWEIGLSGNSPCTLTLLRTAEDGTQETIVLDGIVFPVTSEDGVLFGSPDFGLETQAFSGVFDTVAQAWKECISTGKIVYRSFVEMIAGRFGTAGISGPIGAAQTISEAAGYGILPLMQLFVMISVNLGLFNLFPLPALDGGRLLFVVLEWVRRKPVNPKYEAWIHAAGMVLLLALMALIAVLDISRLIGG